ncbi:Hypothetical protein R9X50_00174300 [Acrodontium crateriforme]|uniref:Uncharacterized protein n=1 Tax=Acrodontium crateriforme TaxID=150365 RepID=A0AAQ3M129_9PEZI|nr:Hypothetical protein R9X50_00174300 [Acrodontium crateriforme]
MALLKRKNSLLAQKIATLQLHLAPLVPLPEGPPHPAFPKTIMAFHLMTEDELDSMAHYYHQSTPSQWTNKYPARMNWDKEFLARPDLKDHSTQTTTTEEAHNHNRRLSEAEASFLADLMKTVEDLQKNPATLESPPETIATGSKNPYVALSDAHRIRIKRRKVGKFIGLVGMETPVEDIAGRVQASIDRAIERSAQETQRNEEYIMGRKKMV